jgi:hypothetical protein
MIWPSATRVYEIFKENHLVNSKRIRNLSAVFESDFLVFVVPALLAFAGYCFVAWSGLSPPSRLPIRIGLITLIALIATATSLVCAITVAFNGFGS